MFNLTPNSNNINNNNNSNNSNNKTKYGTKNYQRMGMIRLTTPNMQIQILGILKFVLFWHYVWGWHCIGRWLPNYQLNEVLKEVMMISFTDWSVAGCKVVNKNTPKNLSLKTPFNTFSLQHNELIGQGCQLPFSRNCLQHIKSTIYVRVCVCVWVCVWVELRERRSVSKLGEVYRRYNLTAFVAKKNFFRNFDFSKHLRNMSIKRYIVLP